MRIIGIDPGSRLTGIGVIEKTGSRLSHLASTTIAAKPGDMSHRLNLIYQGIDDYLKRYQPQVVVIEAVFMHKNPQSALKLGQARGVALLAAARQGCEVAEYSARQIKQAVVGYGGSDKGQVQHMVRQLLQLATVPASDAADALAAAICHAHTRKTLSATLGREETTL